jgi:ribosomal-protein-alanine N-acetyltransferase
MGSACDKREGLIGSSPSGQLQPMPTSPYGGAMPSSPIGGVRLYDATLAPAAVLRGKTVELRPLVAGDYDAWRAAIEANAESRREYDSDENGVLTRVATSKDTFEDHLAQLDALARDDRSYDFGIWRDGQLRGEAHLGAVLRGPTNSAMLGLWIDEELWGQGLAREVFVVLAQFGFEELGLHRIEAFVSPDNAAVRAALEKLVIRHEGTSQRLRFNGGRWQDQERYAITAEEWDERREELREAWVGTGGAG